VHLKPWSDEKFCKGHEPRKVAFTYLWEMFRRPSEAKLKEGVFIGPQIRDLIKNEYFDTLLEGHEKAAWDSFKFVVKGFLGNRRAQNYEEPVNNLLQSYQNLGCNVSEEMHFLQSHLDISRELWCSGCWTWWTFRSTHFFNGEEISSKMELCYARRLLLDFARDVPTVECKGQAKQKKNMILFVLNNELTWKRLYRCSIYVVNTISKQNKSTKHILYQWIVFRYLFKLPFRIIFQTIS